MQESTRNKSLCVNNFNQNRDFGVFIVSNIELNLNEFQNLDFQNQDEPVNKSQLSYNLP